MASRDASAAPQRANEPSSPTFVEVAEAAVVLLAVGQGALLAGWLGLRPQEALRLGGFPAAAPGLFVRWAGLLHGVLATGYALEWLRLRNVSLLVVAKGLTALFLIGAWVVDGLPPLLMVAVGVELTLALAAQALHRPADRSRRSRARLRVVKSAPGAVRPAGHR